MLNQFSLVFVITIYFSCSKQEKGEVYQLDSQNAINSITFKLQNGIPTYSVAHGETNVLNPSNLGFVFKSNDSLYNDFESNNKYQYYET